MDSEEAKLRRVVYLTFNKNVVSTVWSIKLRTKFLKRSINNSVQQKKIKALKSESIKGGILIFFKNLSSIDKCMPHLSTKFLLKMHSWSKTVNSLSLNHIRLRVTS